MAELGHTRVLSCQLGQCSDQVEPDRVGMVLVIGWTAGRVGENNATGGPNSSAELS